MTHPIIMKIIKTGYPYNEEPKRCFSMCAECGEELYDGDIQNVRDEAGRYFCSLLCLCRYENLKEKE